MISCCYRINVPVHGSFSIHSHQGPTLVPAMRARIPARRSCGSRNRIPCSVMRLTNGWGRMHGSSLLVTPPSRDTLSTMPQAGHDARVDAPVGSRTKAKPPKPNYRFTKSDLKRIKQEGPTMEDLRAHFEVQERTKNGEETKVYDFVPYEVLGQSPYGKEPKWNDIKQMSYMEFYAGIRERNWTSEYYNPDAERWELEFFEDSGRLFRPSFMGYRVLVKKENGDQFWVNLDRPGPDNFLRDYMGTCVLWCISFSLHVVPLDEIFIYRV